MIVFGIHSNYHYLTYSTEHFEIKRFFFSQDKPCAQEQLKVQPGYTNAD